MLLLSGPPGSGKTQQVLDQLRDAAHRGAFNVCLLTPTATMAEHLRHDLGREGQVVRPSRVLTIHQFIAQFPAPFEQVSDPILQHIIRKALEQDPPVEFREVADLPGFQESLAGVIDELSSAGASAPELDSLLPACRAEFGPALVEMYSRVEIGLLERQKLTRGQRLRAAALQIAENGIPGIRQVMLDGFFTFTNSELDLIRGIAEQADVTVTLPSWPGADRTREALLTMGFQERVLSRRRSTPETVIVSAHNMEAEVAEVARRILEEASRGRPFREMGVIVRRAPPYVPALEATLERFGIPARFYFGGNLATHPAVQRLIRAVDALLGGWNLESALAAIRMGPASARLDRVDFEARMRIPDRGLETLRDLDQSGGLSRLIDKLAAMDRWDDEAAVPARWATRLKGLSELFPPPIISDGVPHEQANQWRLHAAALRAFEEALDEICQVFAEASEVSLEEFWREARAVIESVTLRVRDRRRDVVHVMDAYEARQWELPVVFVCGLLEDQFPRHHSENPLLPDDARRQLQSRRLHLRTSGEREEEERFLFDLAVTRATERLILSYPAHNANGEETLSSFPLQELRRSLGREAKSDVSATPVRPPPGRSRKLLPRPIIYAEDLREELGRLHAVAKASGVETFLACPFQFFARYTLKLESAPAAPEDRLDAMLQGKVIHQVLAELAGDDRSLETLFERVFEDACRERRVPSGYRTEKIRLEMLRSLQKWRRADLLPRPEGALSEQDFEFALDNGLRVRGRIDRLNLYPGDLALVVDFKYSGPDRLRGYIRQTEEGRLVQAGLYMLAAREYFHLRPAGMLYCTVRKDTNWDGWHLPMDGLERTGEGRTPEALEELMTLAVTRSLGVLREVHEGRVEPAPAEPAICEHCDFIDICRVEETVAVLAAGDRE